jgi:excinuclease ABC subunit C
LLPGRPRAAPVLFLSYNNRVLSERLEFVAASDADVFAAVPAAPAVFLLRGGDPGGEPYVSKTQDLRRRLQRLLGPPTPLSKRLNLREQVRSIEYTPTGSEFESGFLLYRVLRSVFPKTYAARLRIRFAPLIKLHLDNRYPRASVTTRLGRPNSQSFYYGPFVSRIAAEKFANDSLDFFKMRRCVEDLNPDPQFPGCIYSEMKMCLAPCFKGCSDDEYGHEVARVQAYLDSAGTSLVREISSQRDQASADLKFEEAAALHAKLEKLNPVLGQLPEAVRRIDRLRALIVQPSAIPGGVAFFLVDAAYISGPGHFPIPSPEHTKSQSMESRIQESLYGLSRTGPSATLETMEHLAFFKRWLYRGSRTGEVFFADEKGELPFRRIVRGISRVYHGEKPEPAGSTTVSPRPEMKA